MKKEEITTEHLTTETPFLSQIKKENHFNTPINYFELLPEVMSNKNLNNNYLYFNFDIMSWRVLASFSLITLLVFTIANLNSTQENTLLNYDAYHDYITSEEYLNFDDEVLYDFYAETLLSTTDENDAYLDYLIENEIEINTIQEQL